MVYRNYIKRLLDIVLAIGLLAIFSPILILGTITLWIANKGQPFFFQKRPGRYEKLFSIVKFKTMNDDTDHFGNLLPDSKRLTPVGAFFRKTSLDELPQIINVLKGDMSFIGPRPLLIRYLPYYTSREKVRHSVRPGITGMAQVSGRNFLPWDERLEMDVHYVNHLSFKLDLLIFFKTIKNVILRNDVEIVPESKMLDLDAYREKGKVGYFL